VLGPGDCCAVRRTANGGAGGAAATNPAGVNAPPPPGGFGGLNVEGLPILEAALRPACRHRPRQGAAQVADAARGDTPTRCAIMRPSGAHHPEDRPGTNIGRSVSPSKTL